MTLQEYVGLTEGKGIDFDGAFGFQCVDLARDYCKRVLNVTLSPPVEGAKDIWNTYNQEAFTRVGKVDKTDYPLPGDIVIWGSTYGKYGHIAICLDADNGSFDALSQNDPIGSKVKIKTYSYKHVLGWLRPKGGPMSEVERLRKEADDARKERDKNWNLYQDTLKDLHGVKEFNKTLTNQLKLDNETAKTNFSVATQVATKLDIKLEDMETLYSILVKLREYSPNLGALQLLTKSLQKMIKGEW